ncbi:hypothetical protein [Paraburkholderia fungorum]|uniref:hypothetical protein n=1 Tax=Paraburkholderia fungorum TaxID=134537 RepID=UPI00041F78CB|nr:hypothetical protein [Paraburkholderia fungorum]PZR42057.1 MAG: hypothetical protein DI523_32080 [Paraburkholderia fungorum]
MEFCEPVWSGFVVTALLWLADLAAARTHLPRPDVSGFVIELLRHAGNDTMLFLAAGLAGMSFLLPGWALRPWFQRFFVIPTLSFTQHAASAAAGATFMIGLAALTTGPAVSVPWHELLRAILGLLGLSVEIQVFRRDAKAPFLLGVGNWERPALGMALLFVLGTHAVGWW